MYLPCSSVSPRPLAIPPAATSQSPAESMAVVGGESQSVVGGVTVESQSIVGGVTVESQSVVGGMTVESQSKV